MVGVVARWARSATIALAKLWNEQGRRASHGISMIVSLALLVVTGVCRRIDHHSNRCRLSPLRAHVFDVSSCHSFLLVLCLVKRQRPSSPSRVSKAQN